MLQYFHVQHLTGAAFSAKYGIKLKAKKYDYSYMFHPFFDKNSEKTIKYRFFRGRQSEKRSFSVPYSNYKLYFEDKCLESVLICVFSLLHTLYEIARAVDLITKTFLPF